MSDYPCPETHCHLKIGRRHIVLDYSDSDGSETRLQAVFRATRIRVWRIAQVAESDLDFIFQFEYLMSKDSFENITLRTKQAVLLSLIMQSFGAEILKEPKLATTSNDVPEDYCPVASSLQEKEDCGSFDSSVSNRLYDANYHVSQNASLRSETKRESLEVTNGQERREENEPSVSDDLVESVKETKRNSVRGETDLTKELFTIISTKIPSNYDEVDITDADL